MTPSNLDRQLEQELAGLKREYERLKDERVRTEQNLINIKRQLGELEAAAERDYGTSDPDKLAALLEEKRTENARLVQEYSEHVRTISRELHEVEQGVPGLNNGVDGQ